MDLKIFDSADKAAFALAHEMAQRIEINKRSSLGVATGRTMDAVYYHLAEIHKAKKFDCSEANAFALDEYVGLSKGSPNSYESYLNFHLFGPLGFNRAKAHLPNVLSADLDSAGHEYEEKIREAGGIDLQILGIGLNGHIGLNEPGSALDSRTRLVALSDKTRKSNQSLFKGEAVPLTAMTMGVGTILDAKEIILLATGSTKKEIIQKLVNGDVSSKLPASALKLSKNAKLFLDKEAASLIS